MNNIQTLPRPDYIQQRHPHQTNEVQSNTPKLTKWDRINTLYKKVTDLIEIGRTGAGDEIFCRVLTNYAVSKGFSMKKFVIREHGKWIVQEKFCYKGKVIEQMKLWEIELLFLEL